MPPSVVLAATHHDPHDTMFAQIVRVLPRLQESYAAITVFSTPDAGPRSDAWLAGAGVRIVRQPEGAQQGLETLGLVRSDTIRASVEQGAAYVHLCDFDRALHWAEAYPDELREVIAAIPRHDFLILGRTPRAFATHPRVQRDTEAIVNHTFGLALAQRAPQPPDVTAASRGLSRRAAELLLALDAPEPTVGNDCAWPLYLARFPELVIGYAATEGLEWETPDRHVDDIAAAGGLDAWIANFDADPRRWEFRLQLALHEVAAINRWRQ